MRHIRYLLIVGWMLPLSCALLPKGGDDGERAKYPVYRLAKAPKIDGEVAGDAAWRTVPGVSGFRALGGDYTAAKQSTGKMGWTDDALFVAMVCEEPDVALLKDKLKDGDPLWKDNGVEIFLELPGRPGVFQLAVNTIGSHAMGEGKLDIAKWQAAAKKGRNFWSLEMKLPFSCLEATPAPGARWHGAFCRNIWEYASGGDKFTTWPALETRFREPEHFAVLAFQDKSLSAEEAEQLARRMNEPYRKYLSDQIRELAKTAPKYRTALARAKKQKQFQKEATELQSAWQKIAGLSQDPATAPLTEIRQLVARANDIKTRSYELKYRFLIEELLEE